MKKDIFKVKNIYKVIYIESEKLDIDGEKYIQTYIYRVKS